MARLARGDDGSGGITIRLERQVRDKVTDEIRSNRVTFRFEAEEVELASESLQNLTDGQFSLERLGFFENLGEEITTAIAGIPE